MKKFSRREFIGAIAGVGAAAFVGGCQSKADGTTNVTPRPPRFNADELAVASGKDPAELTRQAVDSLGGMSQLVRKGDFVVVKPNIAWNRAPEMAATTNPQVVAELVKMCKEAGAEKVLVIDHIIDRPAEAVLGFTGIRAAAEEAGALVSAAQNESDYRTVDIPKGEVIKSDTCIKEILKADVYINVPIAKSHSATKLTLGMKNQMGCNWDRQAWHQSLSLDQCIAEYATAVRPDLTVLDANRVLLTNGPKGPGETKDIGKMVAGVDPVLVDAYATQFFDMKPEDIGYIKMAHALGVGEMDLTKAKIKSA